MKYELTWSNKFGTQRCGYAELLQLVRAEYPNFVFQRLGTTIRFYASVEQYDLRAAPVATAKGFTTHG